MSFSVVYLTGSPSSGKSTLSGSLKNALGDELLVFEYGYELSKKIQRINAQLDSQAQLRTESAKIVKPEYVRELDLELIELVTRERIRTHIVIDSHAVTKENYGFRITPFGVEGFLKLNPTHIFVLYANSQTIQERILSDPDGRPQVSNFEADMHTNLQAAVALVYGIQLGIPIYYLDSNTSPEALKDEILKRIA